MQPDDLERIETASSKDSVRAYLTKMGHRELLTREGEAALSERIEAGERRVFFAVLKSAVAAGELYSVASALKAGKMKVQDAIRELETESPEFDPKVATRRILRGADQLRKLRAAGADDDAIADLFVSLRLSKKVFDRIILKLRALIPLLEEAETTSF